jgi:hypothetical protein
VSSPIALTAEGIAWVLASLVAILLFGLAHARHQRRVRDFEARRQQQRREDAPKVRRMIADTIEDCNVAAADARRRA